MALPTSSWEEVPEGELKKPEKKEMTGELVFVRGCTMWGKSGPKHMQNEIRVKNNRWRKQKAQRREKLLYLVNSWSSSAAGHVSAAPYLRRLRRDGEERRVKGADGYRVQASAVREGGRTEWQGAGRRGGQRGERKRCSSSSCSLCYRHTHSETHTHTHRSTRGRAQKRQTPIPAASQIRGE